MVQPQTLEEYKTLASELEHLVAHEKIAICRWLCRTDLFWLLWWGFGRKDVAHPWLLARCKEVQAAPDGYLDLWARDHYKSTIITYAKTIQDILASHGDDPLPEWQGLEPTFGIFSHTRPIAKGFLRQIKREFETNKLLMELFPEILWDNPHKDAPKWSEDDGLILKRKNNPKESTIEAWGLVEGQPTGKHFNVLLYDDVVTQGSVNTPEMMAKTLQAWEMSINLGSRNVRRRHIGTRYHFNDAYREIMARGAAKERIYPGTIDGRPEGEPVFKSREQIAELRQIMGPYTFSTQILQNPLADETQGFKKDWLRWHGGSDGDGQNIYIIVDPASEKKKTSDFTSFWVIGLGADENYYILDAVRDRLNLEQRGDVLFQLHRKWRPQNVGYEKYGMQADIEHFKYRMRKSNYHFGIQELGGHVAKNDRIKALIPLFAAGRMYFPDSLFKTDYQGKLDDLIDIFINQEYLAFPVPVHDDMLDCLARILDPDLAAMWPRLEEDDKRDRYSPRRVKRHSAWAA
jgi:phage terminase large subunit-like protein